MRFFIFILIGFCFSLGCNNQASEEQIKKADTLSLNLWDTEVEASEADEKDYIEWANEVQKQVRWINENYMDTLEFETALKLEKYKKSGDEMLKNARHLNELKKELEARKKQVSNLKTDIENQAQHRDSLERFLQQEQQAIDDIREQIYKTTKHLEENKDHLEELQDDIKMLIREVRNDQ